MEKGIKDILDIARLNQLRDSNETALLSEDEREANAMVIDRALREKTRKITQKTK